MDKKKREKIMIALLIPILGFVVYTNVISEKKPPPPPADSQPAPPGPPGRPVPGPVVRTARQALNSEEAQAQAEIAGRSWGRNPFVPAPTPVVETADSTEVVKFTLSSVFPAREGGVAVINGTVLEVGEVFRGYELLEVDGMGVRLGRNNEIFTLFMPEE